MAAALIRFWNWLWSWRKREAVLDDPYATLEQLDKALADPDVAKRILAGPEKREELQRTVTDPRAGEEGMVQGADGVWRAIGDTPMVSIKMFIGSEEEEIEAARPKIIRPQRPPRPPEEHATCLTCYGWGWAGETRCGTCNGKGYVWRSS